MTKLLGLLGGWYGYLAVGILCAGLSGGATYYVVHNANAVVIADLKTDKANQDAADAGAALAQLTGFIGNMTKADNAYRDAIADIAAKYDAITKDFQHAITAKPLPADCRIDVERLRILNAAVAQANRSYPPASP